MAKQFDINPYLLYFYPENVVGFLHFTYAAYIQVHSRLDFFMEENNMKPDQTAPCSYIETSEIIL